MLRLVARISVSAPPMIPPIEETGYQPIFDGKSLAGWDGDPKFWRIENGAKEWATVYDFPAVREGRVKANVES